MYEERVEELCRNGCRGLREWAESQERRAKMNRCSYLIASVSRCEPHRTGVEAKRERKTKKEPVDATHLQVLMLLTSLVTGYVSGA